MPRCPFDSSVNKPLLKQKKVIRKKKTNTTCGQDTTDVSRVDVGFYSTVVVLVVGGVVLRAAFSRVEVGLGRLSSWLD